jgi:hypothetical protein
VRDPTRIVERSNSISNSRFGTKVFSTHDGLLAHDGTMVKEKEMKMRPRQMTLFGASRDVS